MGLVLLTVLLITGCDNKDISSPEELSDDLLTWNAIVMGKLESGEKKKLLVSEDTDNPDLLTDLETITDPDEMIRSGKYDLRWLDVSEISTEDFDFDTIEPGTKIRFATENEELDTHPPTSIARQLEIMN